MNKVRVFVTVVVLATLLNLPNIGPAAAAEHDPGAGRLVAGDGAPLAARLIVDAGGPYFGKAGSPITLDGATVSPDDGSLTYNWYMDQGRACTFDDPNLPHPTLTCRSEGTFTARLCVTDRSTADVSAACVCDPADIIVRDDEPELPECEWTRARPSTVPTGDPVDFTARFTDPGKPNTFTAAWDWGDDTSSPGTITREEGSVSGLVEDQHSYGELGLYTIALTIAQAPDPELELPAIPLTCPPTKVCVFDPISLSPSYPLTDAITKTRIFHKITVEVPELEPGCPQCYCLSSQKELLPPEDELDEKARCAPMAVDDMLKIFLEDKAGRTKIFEEDFAVRCSQVTSATVLLPRSLSAEIVGKEITLWFRDKCGNDVMTDEVWLVPADCAEFPVFISDRIVVRERAEPKEIFFQKYVRIPKPLPEGGRFYLSARKDRVKEILIDDKLRIFLVEETIKEEQEEDPEIDDTVRTQKKVFGESFVFCYPLPEGGCRLGPQANVVEIPRDVMEKIAGRQVIVDYIDQYPHKVSSPQKVWLIHVP